MSNSQFQEKVTIRPSKDPRKAGAPEIEIGGPLQVDQRDRGQDVTVHFLLVQGEGKNTVRVQGTGYRRGNQRRWRGKADAGALQPGRETRAVGLAVFWKRDLDAFETLTWCVPITVGPVPRGAPSPGVP